MPKTSFYTAIVVNQLSARLYIFYILILYILILHLQSQSFSSRILTFTRPSTNSNFHCFNPKGLKLITSLRLGLCHLRFCKFKHDFQDTLNPICNCGTVKTLFSTFFVVPIFQMKTKTLRKTLKH